MLGVPTRMSLPGTTILGPRRERKVQARLGGEEAEAGGQNAGYRITKSVHAELPADHLRVGIEMLPPVSVGENHNFVGLKRGFLIRERAADRRIGPKG